MTRCYVFVEGPDDERFFVGVVQPRLEVRYGVGNVRILTYSGWPKWKTEQFLRGAERMGDYIFVADLDNKPCVTLAKAILSRRFKGLDSNRIQVVVCEIEGWYLAGCNHELLKTHGMHLEDCLNITKEEVEHFCRRTTRIELLAQALSGFSVDRALSRNRSFQYFATKYQLA